MQMHRAALSGGHAEHTCLELHGHATCGAQCTAMKPTATAMRIDVGQMHRAAQAGVQPEHTFYTPMSWANSLSA